LNNIHTVSTLVAKGPKLPVKVWLIHEDSKSLFDGKGDIFGTSRKSIGSVKNDPYFWFIEKYMKTNQCNGEFRAYYIDQKWRENPKATEVNHHTLTNLDFL